jgi:hypothetical protein
MNAHYTVLSRGRCGLEPGNPQNAFSMSDYSGRLICGRVNVKLDPEEYLDDRVYFSLSRDPVIWPAVAWLPASGV